MDNSQPSNLAAVSMALWLALVIFIWLYFSEVRKPKKGTSVDKSAYIFKLRHKTPRLCNRHAFERTNKKGLAIIDNTRCEECSTILGRILK